MLFFYLARYYVMSVPVPVPVPVLVMALDARDQGSVHHLQEIDLTFPIAWG